MTGKQWYKRYPAAFIEGTMGLSLEEKGAYSLCLDLIYSNGGPIPDDARWLSGVCGVSLRRWKILRLALITCGKLHAIDGKLSNQRAEKELSILDGETSIAVASGKAGGIKRAKNAAKFARNIDETSAKAQDNSGENECALNDFNGVGQANRIDKSRIDKKDTSSLRSDVSATPQAAVAPQPSSKPDLVPSKPNGNLATLPSERDGAVQAYNDVAVLVGWPVAQHMTPRRRVLLKARLRDVGGLSGWQQAMARARASPFLRGDGGRGGAHANWTPDLDFFLQQSAFTKLMEGKYDDRGGNAEQTGFAAVLAGARAALDEYQMELSQGHRGGR